MKILLRLTVFAAAGWLAGEFISRTLLAGDEELPRSAKPKISTKQARGGPEAGDRGRAPSCGLAASLAAAPEQLEMAEGALAAELQFADAALAEFPALLEIVAGMKNSSLRRRTAGILFAVWAEKDIHAALAAVGRFPVLSMAALDGALTTWAERDPQALMMWLRDEQVHGWARMQAQTTSLSRLMEQAPEQTLASLKELRLDPHAVQTAIAAWRTRDPAAADRWYAAATPEVQKQFFEAWAAASAVESPGAAWERALRDAPGAESRERALANVFSRWRDDRDGGALKALAALPTDAWYPQLAAAAGRRFAANPENAEQLTAVMPPEMQVSFRGAAIENALESLHNPAAAATHFPHLPADSDERINCADRIAKAWAEAGDFEAAAAWIQSLPRDTARDFATAALAEGVHATDPQAARAWAAEIQSETIRAGVLKKLGP